MQFYNLFNIHSGADLAALVREASVSSLRESMKQSMSSMNVAMNESGGTQSDTVVGVAMRHFDSAFKKIKPSVSEKVCRTYLVGHTGLFDNL